MKKFSKIIYETGKYRCYHGTDLPRFDQNTYDAELDSNPKHEGMRIHYIKYWNGKESHYSTKVIQRFLESRIGQKWSDVYSELCSKLEEKDRKFIDYYVDTSENVQKYWPSDFYVINDTLCYRGERKRWRLSPKPESRIIEFEGKEYINYDNIWYAVTTTTEHYRKIASWSSHESKVLDVFFSTNHYDAHKYYRRNVLCVSKKQVNKKMCRKLRDFTKNKENNETD